MDEVSHTGRFFLVFLPLFVPELFRAYVNSVASRVLYILMEH